MLRFSDIKQYAEALKQKVVGPPGKTLVTKVAGVSFENRQAIIRVMGPETKIKVERDRSNEHDCYAVSVSAQVEAKWFQVGFIPKSLNREVAELLDKNVAVKAVVLGLNKRDDGKFNTGLTIKLSFWD